MGRSVRDKDSKRDRRKGDDNSGKIVLNIIIIKYFELNQHYWVKMPLKTSSISIWETSGVSYGIEFVFLSLLMCYIWVCLFVCCCCCCCSFLLLCFLAYSYLRIALLPHIKINGSTTNACPNSTAQHNVCRMCVYERVRYAWSTHIKTATQQQHTNQLNG